MKVAIAPPVSALAPTGAEVGNCGLRLSIDMDRAGLDGIPDTQITSSLLRLPSSRALPSLIISSFVLAEARRKRAAD